MEKNFTEDQLKAKHEAEMLRRNASKGRAPFQLLTEVFLNAKAEEKEKEAVRISLKENQT